ncbi:nuclear transport factor 2 family protein [Ancylobacter dichloromethanicus]
MNMPEIVKAYFDADIRNDADALVATFAAEGVVKDEGALHQGRRAIRDWWLAAKEKGPPRHHPGRADGERRQGVRPRARVR